MVPSQVAIYATMTGRARKRGLEGDAEDAVPKETLYAKNLNDKVNPDTMKHNLYLLFSTYGDVIDIVFKPKNKRLRGQAHIIFSSASHAARALDELQHVSFFEKQLQMSYAKKRSKVFVEQDDA
ncbi:Piso0_002948 [Millerozyma farinosa CBS 7064]|uniref:Piso0_002948 protein n=1 Tax=Pichia sorbitophila (strain ATCC MYA-4447 / BCRC 22081 / CBS 7064 / NBRC 10061 / NRRL Y-12695) TaxID=559304 RepID=G8YJX6_PICSO|nr:Piso0_002948 [Millerozyma farinosa CBS 7064]CCE80621.1 Piso0_002948 [Millerozyma farinosa CBS 7064]